MYKTSLKIADVIIKMQSKHPIQKMSKRERKEHDMDERYKNFFYKGTKKPDIVINIDIVNNLPDIKGAENIFITYHFQDGKENWRLLKKGSTYIYKCPLDDKNQIMKVNKDFNRVNAYLLPKKSGSSLGENSKEFIKKHKGFVWGTGDIIYDFLQVLLINYFAKKKEAIFTHSIGVKDTNGKGLLFAGKSGAGKSTTARLWHERSKAMVLNDDRIIVRRRKNKFFIHGCPWHGDFNDYLKSRIESAPLKKLFFIHHAPKNAAKKISQLEAFSLLYPSLFPTFWDKDCMENIASFSQDLIKNVPCYSMGFKNDKKVIDFVRDIK